MLDLIIPSPSPPVWNCWLACSFWSVFAVVAHLALGCGCAGKAPVGQGVDCTRRGSSCAQGGESEPLFCTLESH